MNCKSIQEALSVGQTLTPHQQSHFAECPQCQIFESAASTLTHQASLLDAEPPIHLKAEIWQGRSIRKAKPQILAFALTACAVAILAAPFTVALRASGVIPGFRAPLALSYGKPYHAKVFGTYLTKQGPETMNNEIWFDGQQLRSTLYFPNHSVEFDQIQVPQGGYLWTYRNVDGSLKHEVGQWANGDHPNQAPKPVVVSDFPFIINALAPSEPPVGGGQKRVPIAIAFHDKPTMVTPYQYNIVGRANAPFDRWCQDVSSIVTVYRQGDQGRILRIEQVFIKPDGQKLTFESDYDYDPIPASIFDPNKLLPYSSSVPAMPGKVEPDGH